MNNVENAVAATIHFTPIRNVEELIQRWTEVDSKRPDSQSRQAVEMLVEVLQDAFNRFGEHPEEDFTGHYNDPLLYMMNFSICYKKAVSGNRCSVQEIPWVMPYVRYVETVEHFIGYGNNLFPENSFEDCLQALINQQYRFRELNNCVRGIVRLVERAEENKFTDLTDCSSLSNAMKEIADFYSEGDRYSYLSWGMTPGATIEDVDSADDPLFYPWGYQLFDGSWRDWIGLDNDGEREAALICPHFSLDYQMESEFDGVSISEIDFDDWCKKLQSVDRSTALKLQEPAEGEKKSFFELSSFGRMLAVIRAISSNYSIASIMADQNLSPIERFGKISSLRNSLKHLSGYNELFIREKAGECFIAVIAAIIADQNLLPIERLEKISSLCDSEKQLLRENELFIREKAGECFIAAMKQLGVSADMEYVAESNISQAFELLVQYNSILPTKIAKDFVGFYKQHQKLLKARSEERRQVLFEMSHSIKNLLATVADPLVLLKDELSGKQRRTVERALDGIALLRDFALGIHMSMRGKPGDWRKDIAAAGGNAEALPDIIEQALRQAVVNMFHGKYFERFTNAYFDHDLDRYLAAKEAWDAAESRESLIACLQDHFFDFEFTVDNGCSHLFLTDTAGAKTQLMLMLQELCLNAVKNAALVPRSQRRFKICGSCENAILTITLQNSAPDVQSEQKNGLGLIVIKNFAELFEADYQHVLRDGVYTTTLKFDFAGKEA